MKKPFSFIKIFLWTAAALGIALVLFIAGTIIWMRWGYYDELDQIKGDLNKIKGVTVVDIWGHEDITLEEISARVKIENKGEIVMNNLNKNDNGYPASVYITECGGYSFKHLSCSCSSGSTGIGPSVNIGTASYFGQLLGLRFDKPTDIIENYDRIYYVIDSLARVANPLHITPTDEEINMRTQEEFLFFSRKKSKDQDPIFNLLGVEVDFEMAKQLPWECDSCCNE